MYKPREKKQRKRSREKREREREKKSDEELNKLPLNKHIGREVTDENENYDDNNDDDAVVFLRR